MTDPFVPNALPYSPNIAAAVSQAGATVSEQEVETNHKPADESNQSFEPDWQPNESDLVPSFGVERARELLLWLINLELRLPPYTEVSHA